MDAILNILVTGVVVGVTGLGAAVYILKNLIFVCGPNEVLIFSGSRTQTADGSRGYRVIRGGRGMRWPLLESVDSLNLTNMIIEVAVTNAYAKVESL